MIDRATFDVIVERLGNRGRADIEWAETICPPPNATEFACEVIFVICNSGMRYTVALGIFNRVMDALEAGQSATTAFHHRGKTAGIDYVWQQRPQLFAAYVAAADKLEYLETLPWVGPITKYHLAKNFGLDFCKPDVHLQRLADVHKTTPQALCEDLAKCTGYRIATVDTLLWRACADGVVNSRTGELTGRAQ